MGVTNQDKSITMQTTVQIEPSGTFCWFLTPAVCSRKVNHTCLVPRARWALKVFCKCSMTHVCLLSFSLYQMQTYLHTKQIMDYSFLEPTHHLEWTLKDHRSPLQIIATWICKILITITGMTVLDVQTFLLISKFSLVVMMMMIP